MRVEHIHHKLPLKVVFALKFTVYDDTYKSSDIFTSEIVVFYRVRHSQIKGKSFNTIAFPPFSQPSIGKVFTRKLTEVLLHRLVFFVKFFF